MVALGLHRFEVEALQSLERIKPGALCEYIFKPEIA